MMVFLISERRTIKYVYTSHVMNLKMANKTNDADSVLIKLL